MRDRFYKRFSEQVNHTSQGRRLACKTALHIKLNPSSLKGLSTQSRQDAKWSSDFLASLRPRVLALMVPTTKLQTFRFDGVLSTSKIFSQKQDFQRLQSNGRMRELGLLSDLRASAGSRRVAAQSCAPLIPMICPETKPAESDSSHSTALRMSSG